MFIEKAGESLIVFCLVYFVVLLSGLLIANATPASSTTLHTVCSLRRKASPYPEALMRALALGIGSCHNDSPTAHTVNTWQRWLFSKTWNALAQDQEEHIDAFSELCTMYTVVKCMKAYRLFIKVSGCIDPVSYTHLTLPTNREV